MKLVHGAIGLWRRVTAFARRRQLDQDIEDELTFHLEMRRADLLRDGTSEDDAGAAARRRFGNVTALREETREMWTFPSFDSLVQDVRFAIRTLVKSPGFTIVAVLVLAIGIGANTAIFSLVDAMLVRGLPYTQPDELVLLIGNVQRQEVERRGGSYPDFLDWREQSRSFVDMAAYSGTAVTLAPGTGDPVRVVGEAVSAPYFELLDVAPVVGRTFRPGEDETAGLAPVVVLSHRLWQEQFEGDTAVVGQIVRVNGQPHDVIGVMPAGFAGVTDQAQVWIPFVNAGFPLDSRGSRWLQVLARLESGVTIAQAQIELDAISARLEAAYPDSNEARGVEVASFGVEAFGDLRPAVLALMGAVSFVLLIACANVANLLIGRSEVRQREIAVRTALGAGRGRLLRQLVTESLVLSAIAAGAGLAVARTGLGALVAYSPVTFPSFLEPGLNVAVLGFTVGVAVVCGLALGVAPALHTRFARLAAALKDSARGSTSAASHRVRSGLVVAEVALAVVLLVGASLMIRTVSNLTAVEPGFEADQLLTFSMSIPREALPAESTAPEADAGPPPFVVSPRELRERLLAVPGVVDAALSSDLPLGGGGSAVFYAAEGDDTTVAESRPRSYYHFVTPSFFETLGVPFLHGRTFLEEEMRGDGTAVIVSENVVRRFWPGENPIGRRISLGSREFAIVGVVAETLYRSLPVNPTADPDIFLPYTDRGVQGVILRTAVPAATVAGQARQVIRNASPEIVVYQVNPIADLVADQTAQSRFTGWLMSLFAGVALLLAVVGIYGVMSYLVTQRTREFGIRLALGAGRRAIVGAVGWQGLKLVGLGLTIGAVAAFALSRLLATQFLDALLFDVALTDVAGVAAIGLLGVVALLACALPAVRATRVDPVVALRSE